jgi:pilus assembly protein CpaE
MPEKKILIIDADVASRNFIARALQDKYEIIQAGSGKEGLIHAWRDRPALAIIDPSIADLPGEEIAKKLKQDARTMNMPLIALSGDASMVRIKACLDAGFNEYITKSGQAVSSLNDTINRLLGVTNVAVKQGGWLMVMLSAKGGVGTSALSANIAMNIAQSQPEARVAVLDMVLPIGSIAPIVGYNRTHNIVTIADMPPNEITPDFFRDQLPALKDWRFHLVAGSPDPESSNHLNAGRIWNIVTALKMSYDYVLVDIGRSLSKISLPLIQNADLVTPVVSTDLSAVTLTKTLLEYLKSKSVNPDSIFTVLNRAVGLEGLSKVEVEKVLGIPIKFTIPFLGSNFSYANNNHFPFSVKFPNDSAAFVFKDIAREMCALARKLRAQ